MFGRRPQTSLTLSLSLREVVETVEAISSMKDRPRTDFDSYRLLKQYVRYYSVLTVHIIIILYLFSTYGYNGTLTNPRSPSSMHVYAYASFIMQIVNCELRTE